MKSLLLVLLAIIFTACSPKMDKSAPGNVHTYWVDSTKVPCTGVAPQQCLRVKKGKDFATLEWEYFYASIEGFHYEPGNSYQLLVKETHRSAAETPADASSIIYTLVEVVEKKTDAKLRLYDIWALEAINDEEANFTDKVAGIHHPTIEFNLTTMRFMGTDGCNGYGGSIDLLTNSALTLGALTATEKACGSMAIPNQVHKALSAVTAYRIKGLKLQLMDDSGAVLLRYRKVD